MQENNIPQLNCPFCGYRHFEPAGIENCAADYQITICELDGYWEDQHGNEFYWHCGQPAAWIASRYDNPGQEAITMRACGTHVGDFEEAVEIPGATRSQRVSGSSNQRQ